MQLELKRHIQMRLLFIPVVFFMIYLLVYLVDPFSENWKCYLDYSAQEIFVEFIMGILLSWAIIEFSQSISSLMDRLMPWSGSSLVRFLAQTALIIVSVIIMLYLQDRIFVLIYGNQKLTPQENLSIWQFCVVSIIVSVIVSLANTGYYLLKKWKISMSEAAELRIHTLELKEVAMHAELQSLKLQLDPHFMFNNFSTLSELMNGDLPQANSFLDNLARVYRYMIQNLKKNLVPLKEEIKFVTAYLYLISIRHGDNVRVTIELGEQAMEKSIPPITIQLLIENAIKHNIASAENPLYISISSISDQVVISNNLQRIPVTIPSSGMGLHNIKERYRLLAGQEPLINDDNELFQVFLPLL